MNVYDPLTKSPFILPSRCHGPDLASLFRGSTMMDIWGSSVWKSALCCLPWPFLTVVSIGGVEIDDAHVHVHGTDAVTETLARSDVRRDGGLGSRETT